MSKAITETMTAKEIQLLAAALVSMDNLPKPDYEQVAKLCGYKNAGVASVMYGQVRRKLMGTFTPRKAASTKRSADDDDAASTPKQPSKKRASTKKKVKAEPVDDDASDDIDTPIVSKSAVDPGTTVKQDDTLNDDFDTHDLLYPEGSYGTI